MRVYSCIRGVDCVIKTCCQPMTICATTSRKQLKQHKGKKNLFNFNSCLRLYVLDVACFVDGLSVYFAYRLCLKRDRICIDLSVC